MNTDNFQKDTVSSEIQNTPLASPISHLILNTSSSSSSLIESDYQAESKLLKNPPKFSWRSIV